MDNQESGYTAQSAKNKIWWALIIIIAVVFGIFAYKQNTKTLNALGEDISLTVYTKNGKTTGGILSVPFLTSYGDKGINLSGAVDFNKDGRFGPEEWLLKNYNVHTQKDWNTNLPFKSSQNFDAEAKIRVVMSGEKLSNDDLTKISKSGEWKEKTIPVTKQNLDDILGEEAADNPEDSMKFGNTAYAQSGSVTLPANVNGVPDFSQRKAECAPTVAANGLYSLAMKNGATDKLPTDPLEMIAGLKGDMLWTHKSGVVPDNFVAGKNKWAVTHGLPIKTEKIGDGDGRGTLDEIKKALGKGAAVEMRIRFADQDLKVIGGHIVSVVAVREVDGKTVIDVNDPASPVGTETYTVEANTLENYPYHDGYTVVGWGFSQIWEGAPMGGSVDVMTEDELRGIREFAGEKKTIKAINYNGKFIPLTEVHVIKGDHCDDLTNSFPHWHANNGSFATATDGTKAYDNGGCGFGKTKDVPEIDVQVP